VKKRESPLWARELLGGYAGPCIFTSRAHLPRRVPEVPVNRLVTLRLLTFILIILQLSPVCLPPRDLGAICQVLTQKPKTQSPSGLPMPGNERSCYPGFDSPYQTRAHISPHCEMVTSWSGLDSEFVRVCSTFLTTSIPSITRPKTTCLPFK
jgi:hypothetical protein